MLGAVGSTELTGKAGKHNNNRIAVAQSVLVKMLCFKQRDWHSARASCSVCGRPLLGGGDLKNKRVPALAQGVIHLTFYRFKTVDEEYVPRALVKKNMVPVSLKHPGLPHLW